VPVLRITTVVRAPAGVCFDLARSVELHIRSTARTRERAVAGVVTGLMGLHDEVTWEATHLGIRQRLTSRITAYDPPRYFRDSMVRGAFARFDHDHFFAEREGITVMDDVFDYTSPLGALGRAADALFLRRLHGAPAADAGRSDSRRCRVRREKLLKNHHPVLPAVALLR
jgi:ligand-binding SRPBCC domain-containing protein